MVLSRSVPRPFPWWDCTLNNTLIDCLSSTLLSPKLSKECVLFSPISLHVCPRNSLLNPPGFRAGHSAETALLVLTERRTAGQTDPCPYRAAGWELLCPDGLLVNEKWKGTKYKNDSYGLCLYLLFMYCLPMFSFIYHFILFILFVFYCMPMFLCEALWVCLLYEKCYINKVALPIVACKSSC